MDWDTFVSDCNDSGKNASAAATRANKTSRSSSSVNSASKKSTMASRASHGRGGSRPMQHGAADDDDHHARGSLQSEELLREIMNLFTDNEGGSKRQPRSKGRGKS